MSQLETTNNREVLPYRTLLDSEQAVGGIVTYSFSLKLLISFLFIKSKKNYSLCKRSNYIFNICNNNKRMIIYLIAVMFIFYELFGIVISI